LQLYRTTDSVEPRPHGGGHPAVLTPEDLERLRAFIADRPDATLEECCRHLGSSCSLATISRALSRLGLPRKKKTPRACDQDSPEIQEQRRAFCEGLAGIDPRRLVVGGVLAPWPLGDRRGGLDRHGDDIRGDGEIGEAEIEAREEDSGDIRDGSPFGLAPAGEIPSH
jgi:hypothetical protein